MSTTWNAWTAALCCAALGGCGTPGGSASKGDDPVRVIELQHVDADALADELSEEYGTSAQFVSDPVTNALLIFAPEPMLERMAEVAIDVDVYDGAANSILRCSATDAARQRAVYPQGPPPEEGEQFVLDFADIDLSELAEVFANAYRVPVITDERLQGRVSLVEKQPIDPAQAYSKFTEVFEENGFAVVQGSSGELKILPSACLELARLVGGAGTTERELRLARALEARGPSAVLCLGNGTGKSAPEASALNLSEAVREQTHLLEFPDPFVDPIDEKEEAEEPQGDASSEAADADADAGATETAEGEEAAEADAGTDAEEQAEAEADAPADADDEDTATEEEEEAPEQTLPDAAAAPPAPPASDDDEDDEAEDDEEPPLRQYQAELADVVEVIQKVLGKEIRYDRNVRGLVSVIAEEPVNAERAYQLLASVLELRGFTLELEPKGDLSVVLDRCVRVGRGPDPDEEGEPEEGEPEEGAFDPEGEPEPD